MRTRLALTVTLAVLAALVPVGAPVVAATSGSAATADAPCAGRVVDPAGGLTVVSVQGARFGDGAKKTAARIVAFGPNGTIQWVFHAAKSKNIVWSYDIDPLPNGNLFAVGTHRGTTVMYEIDPATGEAVWSTELDLTDTHDADVLGPHRIVIANMRNYNEETGKNNDRLVIYNRTSGEFGWEWLFRNHYPKAVGGSYTEDWTHVNDVDKVGENHFLVSPRNFDQVILVNRTSGEIDLKLGSDGKHRILQAQHNPDYLESRDGDPTFLVADSENDRIVEYEHTADGWNRTWRVGSGETLNWPRDADRLQNGNTLVGDSRNNRVIEVTPEGEVVWEVYAPWLVYDAERLPGDGSTGPTIADQNASGSLALENATPPNTSALERCDAAISQFHGGWGENLQTRTPAASTTATATWTDDQGDVEKVGPGRNPNVVTPGSLAGIAAIALLVGGAFLLFREG